MKLNKLSKIKSKIIENVIIYLYVYVDFDKKDAEKLKIDMDRVSNTIQKMPDYSKDSLGSK